VTTGRSDAIREVSELEQAARTLRAELRLIEVKYRRTRLALEKGDSCPDVFSASGGGISRKRITEALESYEQQQHRTRTAIVAVALAEGMSVSGIGRAWGFSRQLASRYAREAIHVVPPPRRR
jgi:phage-related minor tail protein